MAKPLSPSENSLTMFRHFVVKWQEKWHIFSVEYELSQILI